MSEQITPMIMGKVKMLLKQPNLTSRTFSSETKGGYQEMVEEILKDGRVVVLKIRRQDNKQGTFNCLVLEIDGKEYIGGIKELMDMHDLLAPIRYKNLELGRKNQPTQR